MKQKVDTVLGKNI